MKNIIYIGILISVVSTYASAQWFAPSARVCERYDGLTKDFYHKPTQCMTYNLRNAAQMCHDMGGRLPTINQLVRVMKSCGGKISHIGESNWMYNRKNKAYHACCQRKGFMTDYKGNYWSSSIKNTKDGYWMYLTALFRGAEISFSLTKTDLTRNYVRCVK